MILANVTKNRLIFVVLSVMLVSTIIAYSRVTSAKNNSTSTLTSPAPTTRIFNILTTKVPGFNESKGVQKANLTSDQYSLQTILVNQGDRVVINLYNMEAPSGDMHSFTIDAPYNINIDTTPRQDGTTTFVADHPGIFKFYCKHHLPGMVGELIVLPKEM
jgi:nitrous oxide reductase